LVGNGRNRHSRETGNCEKSSIPTLKRFDKAQDGLGGALPDGTIGAALHIEGNTRGMPEPWPWTARIEAEFAANNLTRSWRDALLALASFRGHGGEIFPSQASVAARAQCSERTVRRAIAMGVQLGLMVVLPRRRWAKGRYVRTSNRYVIGVPDRAVVPGQRAPWPRRASTGQIGLVQDKKEREVALSQMRLEAAAAPDLLAMRRAAMARGMIGAAVTKAW
jgi:Helix-turn-helix domain